MTEILLLCAGFIAGAINTLAGGGSFVLFPALVFAGVPPVIANASNTYASLPGYVSGAIGFWKDIVKVKDRLVPYSFVALVFGLLGAEILLRVSNEQFGLVVPWLMLFAVVLFAFGSRINVFILRHTGGHTRAFGAALWVLLAAISVYGGFFNAGLGVLLLAFLAFAGFSDIHAMNGLKLWVSSLISVIGAVRFALAGAIDWYHGSIALVGVTVGGYLAARLAHFVPQPVLRAAIIIYAAVLTGWFFWQAYGA